METSTYLLPTVKLILVANLIASIATTFAIAMTFAIAVTFAIAFAIVIAIAVHSLCIHMVQLVEVGVRNHIPKVNAAWEDGIPSMDTAWSNSIPSMNAAWGDSISSMDTSWEDGIPSMNAAWENGIPNNIVMDVFNCISLVILESILSFNAHIPGSTGIAATSPAVVRVQIIVDTFMVIVKR